MKLTLNARSTRLRGACPSPLPTATAARGWSARSLRTAVTVLFVLDGFVFGSWAVRVPDVSAQVAATHASLGAALLCVSLGALATMRLTGALCERLGTGLVSAAVAVLLCASVVLPGLATSITELSVTLIVFGALTGMMNVAVNSLGVQLQAQRDRPLLPALHAAFSFGGLGGSLLGGLAAAFTTPVVHLLAVACAGVLTVAWVVRPLLAGDSPAALPLDGERSVPIPATHGTRLAVVTLGVIAGCTAFGEGALTDWGALHLTSSLGASPLAAAAGYAGFSLAMGCARLGGHRLIEVLGETRLLVWGALLAAGGTLLAALSPLIGPALLGFVLVGLGLANIFPLAIGRAGAIGGASAVGLASTVGYAGLLGGPPLIGFLTAHTGLPVALTTISVLAVVAAGLAPMVSGQSSFLTRSPWYAVGLLARPGGLIAPVGLGLRLAAERHVTALAALVPSARPEITQHTLADDDNRLGVPPYPGLEHLSVDLASAHQRRGHL